MTDGRSVLKYFLDVAGAVFISMIFLPLYYAFGIFVMPLLIARSAWRDGAVVKAAVFLTLGSWPLWLILYAWPK